MTIVVPEWVLWIIAAMFLISAGLMAWEFIERRRFKNVVRRAIDGKMSVKSNKS